MVGKRSTFLLGRAFWPIFRCVWVSFRETTVHLKIQSFGGKLGLLSHVSRSQETGDAENPAAQLMEEKDTEPGH